ncbi:13150_t:CDS:1, partial [Ambispora gerdemannii]
MIGAEEVFRTWEEVIKEFTNVAREVTRKRSEKFIPIIIHAAHSKLQERVTFVRGFRKQHEQLNSMEKVKLAYESVKDIDVLDVSTEGTVFLTQAENSYNESVLRVKQILLS